MYISLSKEVCKSPQVLGTFDSLRIFGSLKALERWQTGAATVHLETLAGSHIKTSTSRKPFQLQKRTNIDLVQGANNFPAQMAINSTVPELQFNLTRFNPSAVSFSFTKVLTSEFRTACLWVTSTLALPLPSFAAQQVCGHH